MASLVSPLTAARAFFDPAPDTIYLDAATYGLPPRPTVAALELALRTWQDGTAAWARDWEPAGDRSRALFAQLIGSREDEIALIPTASVGVGVVASGGVEIGVGAIRVLLQDILRIPPPIFTEIHHVIGIKMAAMEITIPDGVELFLENHLSTLTVPQTQNFKYS